MPQPRRLVLGSTSRYRKELLGRLGIPFEIASPAFDETPLRGEKPADSAGRLATGKARSLARAFPDALIIGADQVASLGATRLDKPGTHENAVKQLRALSGRSARFDTAVALLDARSGKVRAQVVSCKVKFRRLERRQIDAYLRREQPYDCAASAKAEGLGIALIERIETDDPTSLIGLPLIALTGLLRKAGVDVL